MAYILTVKKYKKLDEQKTQQLQQIYNELSSEDQTNVVKQGKKVKNISLFCSGLFSLALIVFGIVGIFLPDIGTIMGIVIMLCSIPTLWYFYCAMTWNKVEPYEYLRLIGSQKVQAIISKEN
ncbi:MAG: hypothetical protein E7351_00445 [Clostridiales bacterium]|nr:hypothetical protein [Clostridiales bacterium]